MLLPGWIICDGNYPDFTVGDEHYFALECWETHQRLLISNSPRKELIPVREANYRATGEVLYHNLDRGLLMIDFGLVAYLEHTTYQNDLQGKYLSGMITLGVDYYIYKDFLRLEEDIPALMYHWRIDQILLSTDAGKEVGRMGHRQYDQYMPRRRTDAWNETNGGLDNYLLSCERLSDAPRK